MSQVIGLVPNDGYTETAFIAEVARIHPAIRFAFRPIPNERRTLIKHRIGQTKDVQQPVEWTKVIASQVKSWDLKDEKGQPVPCDKDTVAKLKPSLYERIWGIVMGVDAGDEDPQAAPKANDSGLSIDDLLAGKSPETSEESDQKNSSTGSA